jgi:FlaA1/EpsC-like NDP-sugar epimerase
MTEGGVKRPGRWAGMARWSVDARGDVALGVLDAVLMASAFALTLLLRFDGSVPTGFWRDFGRFLPFAVISGLIVNKCWGLYGQVWRHASIQEAQRLLGAITTQIVVLLVAQSIVGERLFPMSVTLLGTGLGAFFSGAVRFQSRLFSFRRRSHVDRGLGIVVIGGRDAGAAVVSEMLRHPDLGFRPVAIVDPDPRIHRRTVLGVRVEGGIDALPDVVAATGAHQALLAMSSTTPEDVRFAAEMAEEAGVALKIVPDIRSRMGSGISLRDIRDVRIEDLLGRLEVTTDLEAVERVIRGRRVLITGAGGSIGSEIARQVATFGPDQLVLLDHDETHLHDVAASLTTRAVQVLADIRDRTVVHRVFAAHRPEVVFHAAAHKHVPLLEDHPREAAATNVLGTRNIAEACRREGTERFVFISTDKAVDPSSVMGASKRTGEHLTQVLQPHNASWCAVRFGNVLGSRGSVIPTFMRQIEAGGPVTITDPRMTRYFMSIEEAVQLVLQATALAEGGEVFVLDMGEPVRIVDLAERMVRLSGRRVGADIDVVVTGARPGEKLHEELHTADEAVTPTIHPSINQLRPSIRDIVAVLERVDELEVLTSRYDDEGIRAHLFRLVGPRTPPRDTTARTG